MNLERWLATSKKQLEASGVLTARLDASVLLAGILDKDKSFILAHPEFEIPVAKLAVLDKQIERRARHEPLAYIRGKSEFYGRDFEVNSHTLVPRPETEAMIELLLNQIEDGRWKTDDIQIVDVGTGSGCLAITAKLEVLAAEVIATDISEASIKTALKNAQKLQADVEFCQGNLLEPIQSSVLKPQSIILANLPYVPDNHTINPAAMHEPKHAIFGGPDGLEVYRKLFEQISAREIKPKFVFTESLPFQHQELSRIANQSGYKKKTSADFIQVFELVNLSERPQA